MSHVQFTHFCNTINVGVYLYGGKLQRLPSYSRYIPIRGLMRIAAGPFRYLVLECRVNEHPRDGFVLWKVLTKV